MWLLYFYTSLLTPSGLKHVISMCDHSFISNSGYEFSKNMLGEWQAVNRLYILLMLDRIHIWYAVMRFEWGRAAQTPKHVFAEITFIVILLERNESLHELTTCFIPDGTIKTHGSVHVCCFRAQTYPHYSQSQIVTCNYKCEPLWHANHIWPKK